MSIFQKRPQLFCTFIDDSEYYLKLCKYKIVFKTVKTLKYMAFEYIFITRFSNVKFKLPNGITFKTKYNSKY